MICRKDTPPCPAASGRCTAADPDICKAERFKLTISRIIRAGRDNNPPAPETAPDLPVCEGRFPLGVVRFRGSKCHL